VRLSPLSISEHDEERTRQFEDGERCEVGNTGVRFAIARFEPFRMCHFQAREQEAVPDREAGGPVPRAACSRWSIKYQRERTRTTSAETARTVWLRISPLYAVAIMWRCLLSKAPKPWT
jgi:hypothetical protein